MAKSTAVAAANEPFHPNIKSLPGLQTVGGNTQLTRGYIQSVPLAGDPSKPVRVNFLYNPSTISTTYGLDQGSGILPTFMRSADQNQGTYAMTLNQTVGFSLLFDRTYEIWDPSSKWHFKDGPGEIGVEYDIQAFKQLVGLTLPKVVLNSSATVDSNLTTDVVAAIGGGIMYFTQVMIYVGGATSLRYFGVVEEIDVSYTHWTQKMVPQRATVSLSVNLLPKPSATSANSSGYGDLGTYLNGPIFSNPNGGLPPIMPPPTPNPPVNPLPGGGILPPPP